MKKILALLLAMMMVFALCACGDSSDDAAATEETTTEETTTEETTTEADAAVPADDAAAGDVTWADYQAYLIEYGGANAPDLDEFTEQVNAVSSWDEIDQTASPWDQMFSTIGLSTWEEFQAGTVKEPAVEGGVDASATGGASGEASGEGSGEAAGDVPASGTEENTAHGGTEGATTEADYQAYLKAFLAAEMEVNTTMTEENQQEFIALIEAGDYETFPMDMMFSGMLTTGAAMTYDEFVAANGVY